MLDLVTWYTYHSHSNDLKFPQSIYSKTISNVVLKVLLMFREFTKMLNFCSLFNQIALNEYDE